MTEEIVVARRHDDRRSKNHRPYRKNHRNNFHHNQEEVSTEPQVVLSLEEAQEAISPFDLFAAYLLGVTEHDRFKLVSVQEIAKRFHTSPETIDTLVAQYHLTKEDLKQLKGFDLNLARLDIQVAPEGISRSAVARQIYEEFEVGPSN